MKTKQGGSIDVRNMHNMDKKTALRLERNLEVYEKRKMRATKAGVCAQFRSSYLWTLDEKEFNKPEIQKIVMDVVAKLNDSDSASDSELEFVKIEKAEYVPVCGGQFYFFLILVEDGSKTQTTIEKMVWEGTSSQVLSRKKRNLSSKDKEKKMNHYSSIKKFKDLARVVMFDIAGGEGMEVGMRLEQVLDVEEHPETVTDGPAIGLFKFKTYTLTLEATTRKGTILAIEALVLNRIWFQIMDDKKEDFFRSWRNRMLRATEPPTCPTNPKPDWIQPSLREPIPLQDCSTLYYPIDFCSPQIHTQIWLVLEDHNYKENTHLEFVKVIKAISFPTAGTIFDLTFQANDQGTLRTFQIEVHDAFFVRFWTPLTPLNLCPAGDEEGEQIGQKIDMYNSTAFTSDPRRYSKRKKSYESFQESLSKRRN